MKKCFLWIVPLVLLAGCTQYSRLLKSTDNLVKYQAALRYYDTHDYNKVVTLLRDVAPVYSGTLREDTIQFYAAASFHHIGDYTTSGGLLEDFRRIYGQTSPFREQAEMMYAMGLYYSSPPAERDQTDTRRAIVAINEFLERYPESARREAMAGFAKELQEKLYDKEFLNARSYYKTQKYKSAVVALRNALDASPANPHREEMMYLAARSGWLLARNSVAFLQRDRYLSMMDYGLNLLSEFPRTQYAGEVNRMMDQAREYLAATDPAQPATPDNPAQTQDNESQPE